jgi:hypothetical protein
MRAPSTFLLVGFGLSLVALAPGAQADELPRKEIHVDVQPSGPAIGGVIGGVLSFWGAGHIVDGNFRLPVRLLFGGRCGNEYSVGCGFTKIADHDAQAATRASANAEIRSGDALMLRGLAGGAAGGLLALFSGGRQTTVVRTAADAGSKRPVPFRSPTWADRSQGPLRLKEMRVPSLSWKF